MENKMTQPQLEKFTKYFALVIGILFVLAGVGGFLPIITQPAPADALPLHLNTSHGRLLGLFPVNIAHNIFHFTVGVFGLLSYKQYATAKTFSKGLAVTLGILTVLGFFPNLNTLFGWLPIYGHAIWLHGLEAIVAAYLGYFAHPQRIN
ncbi:MAG TPA: DUF4383 domain-containing protein [Anaerolineae bacterium]|nr:DUF4383 domain-containing protein [Anaerolineae bacterium]